MISRKVSLLLTVAIACAVTLAAAFHLSKTLGDRFLNREATTSAVHWAEVVLEKSPGLVAELDTSSVTQTTMDVLRFASSAGGIFRFKLFDRHGLVVHASRPEDVGEVNVKPYFMDLVRKGETYAKIEREEDFGSERSVVSEAYVPIMRDGEFLGAVEVYVDATSVAARLDSLVNTALAVVAALVVSMALLWSFFNVRDIRSREQALRDLRKTDEEFASQNERFTAAMNNLPVGVCMYDGEKRLLVCNPEFGRMYQLTADVMRPGTPLQDILDYRVSIGQHSGANADEYRESRRKWLDATTPATMTEPLNDGRTIRISRQPLEGNGWVSIHEDITRQINADKAQRESERQFRDAVEGSLQGFYIARNWKFQFANQAMADIFGYESPDELLALSSTLELFAPHEHERIQTYNAARKRGEQAPEYYEADGLRKDGTPVTVELRLRKVEWLGEKAIQCVAMDITDRKKAENELIRHRDQLQNMVDAATQELKVKADELKVALAKEKRLNEQQRHFLSVATHEFRTPVAVIDSSIQRMLRRKDEITPKEIEERGRKIRAAVKTITTLMESTLSAAKHDSGKVTLNVEECNLREIVADAAMRQLELIGDSGITVDIEACPEKVSGDKTALEQIFTNLLNNAVKYSDGDPDIAVKAWQEEGMAFVSMRDRGIGIDQDELPRLFSRFFRASTASGIPGTGIGLNLVKTLVELHGGSISVNSVKGEGSTFTVCFPVAGPAVINPATKGRNAA